MDSENQIAAMDSKIQIAAMYSEYQIVGIPREWPAVEESALYKCGMLDQYLEKEKWEDDEAYLDKMITATYNDEMGEIRKITYEPRIVKIFMDQVRDSRGYDVTIGLPSYFGAQFLVYPDDNKYFKPIYDLRDKALQVAISHINSKTGRLFKLEKLLNYVRIPSRVFFLKFLAKDTSSTVPACEIFLAAVFTGSKPFDVMECLIKPKDVAPTKRKKCAMRTTLFLSISAFRIEVYAGVHKRKKCAGCAGHKRKK